MAAILNINHVIRFTKVHGALTNFGQRIAEYELPTLCPENRFVIVSNEEEVYICLCRKEN